MTSEQLGNVRLSWVAFGWFAAAAATGVAILALDLVGLLHPAREGGGGWVLLAVAAGFLAGGWVTGWRTGTAPVLHGVGIGLFSLVVWLAANLLAGALGVADWSGLSAAGAAGVLAVQVAAAVAGAWYGTRHHALNTASED